MFRLRYFWLKQLFARWFSPARPARRHSKRLFVTSLDERVLPSTYTVTTTADSGTGSLRAALSSGDDTIKFSSSGATNFYTGTNTVTLESALPTISSSLAIIGPPITGGGTPHVVITRNLTAGPPPILLRIVDIDNGYGNPSIDVSLQNLEIYKGDATHGGDAHTGTLNDGQGGGIRFLGYGSGNTLTIQGCNISDNLVTGYASSGGKAFGGGIYTSDVDLTIQGSVITGNVAENAIGATGNYNVVYGGGIFSCGGTVNITGSTISYNSVTAQVASGDIASNAVGGGVCIEGAALTLNDSVITGNTATGSSTYNGGNALGGGLYDNGLSATLTRDQVTYNYASGGTAHFFSGSSHPTISGGSGDGGGIAAIVKHTGGSFVVTDCEVDNNQAVGGPATNDSDNHGATGGDASDGGMDVLTENDGGTVTTDGSAIGCTFAFNQATSGDATAGSSTSYGTGTGSAAAGNAFAGGATVAQLEDCTLYGNTATGGDATRRLSSSNGTTTLGTAIGGGFGAGMIGGFTDGDLGDLFAEMPVDYHIYNSTIADNSLVTPTDAGFTSPAIGGGIGDATVMFDIFSTTVTAYNNVVLYSTIVAQNRLNSFT